MDTISEWTTLDIGGFFVYALLGDEDVPLYVGASSNVIGRVGTHLQAHPKRGSVRRVAVRQVTDSAAMYTLETKLIRQLRPIWNISGLEAEERARRSRERAQGPVDPSVAPCRNCGRGLRGTIHDRPRNGRCPTCAQYFRRNKRERPMSHLSATDRIVVAEAIAVI